MALTIQELLDKHIAFMGSNWVDDESVKDGPMPGMRYEGQIPCINCNDVFCWGCADGVEVTEADLPMLEKAVEDCDGDLSIGAMLYCARKYEMRPQGAVYSHIPRKLWPVFDECGPIREIDMCNPHKQGEYKCTD